MRWLTQDKLYLAAQIPDVQWQPVFVDVGLMGLAGLLQDLGILQQSASQIHSIPPNGCLAHVPVIVTRWLSNTPPQFVLCNHIIMLILLFLAFIYLRVDFNLTSYQLKITTL